MNYSKLIFHRWRPVISSLSEDNSTPPQRLGASASKHGERLKPGDRTPIGDNTDLSFSQFLSYRFVLPGSMYEHIQSLKS